jgi:hypothetical protein
LSATGNISTSAGNITATAGSITAGTSLTATTSASVGTTLTVDTIAEKTASAGVTVGGVLLKSGVTAASSVIISSGTPTATTSGTNVTYSSIPTWVKRVTIMFRGVSLSGTDYLYVQIGPSGGLATTGYISTSAIIDSTSASTTNATDSFVIGTGAASRVLSGTMTISLLDATNFYYVSNHTGKTNSATACFGGGDVALSGLMTQLKIFTTLNTFDAGSVNILYE